MNLEINLGLLQGLTLEEFLLLWASVNKGTPASIVYTRLGVLGFGTPLYDTKSVVCDFQANNKAKDFVNGVLEKSLITSDTKDLKELASKLKSIFPKGSKDGTNTPWADGVALIEKRLKIFFKKYGEYPYEDIIKATQKYVDSFNGNYRLMRTLRYFIWKESRGAAGDVESTSDLLTFLERADDVENLRDDWTSTII